MTATPIRNPLAAALKATPVSERAYPVLPHFPKSFDNAQDALTPAQQLENLLTVVRYIVAHPETLNMQYYHSTPDGGEIHARFRSVDELMVIAHGCGTVHCICGHAIAMAGKAGLGAIGKHFQDNMGSQLLGLPFQCFGATVQEVPGSLQRFLAGLPYATPEATLAACAKEILSGLPN